jgi:prepilin signal peptidase PulO-like enzyme (type II secretory pathway)
MKVIVAAVCVALLGGYLAGGRISRLAELRLRFPFLAPLGLALQVLPGPGRLTTVLLIVSFGVLSVFALANIRTPGFPLIMLGMALNLCVIAVNGGMPVTRQALLGSGQQDTLSLLIQHGGSKHHLASSSDVLLTLADVIPIHAVGQVVSLGDLATDAGVVWVIVAGMRRTRWPGEEGAHMPGGLQLGRLPD